MRYLVLLQWERRGPTWLRHGVLRGGHGHGYGVGVGVGVGADTGDYTDHDHEAANDYPDSGHGAAAYTDSGTDRRFGWQWQHRQRDLGNNHHRDALSRVGR